MAQTQALRAPETPKEGIYQNQKSRKINPTIKHAWPTEWKFVGYSTLYTMLVSAQACLCCWGGLMILGCMQWIC
jgi:hypothetical protein